MTRLMACLREGFLSTAAKGLRRGSRSGVASVGTLSCAVALAALTVALAALTRRAVLLVLGQVCLKMCEGVL